MPHFELPGRSSRTCKRVLHARDSLRQGKSNAEFSCPAASDLAKPSGGFADGVLSNQRRTLGVNCNEMLSGSWLFIGEVFDELLVE